MRALLLPSRGDANAPARSVEQPAASHVPSSLEQPADPFTSITALTVWLKEQGDESSSPELRRLRAAVLQPMALTINLLLLVRVSLG